MGKSQGFIRKDINKILEKYAGKNQKFWKL